MVNHSTSTAKLNKAQEMELEEIMRTLKPNQEARLAIVDCLEDFKNKWEDKGKKPATDWLIIEAYEAIKAEGQEEKPRQRKAEVPEALKGPVRGQLFANDAVQKAVTEAIHQTMTPSERARTELRTLAKLQAARLGNAQFAETTWGGFLDEPGFKHFMFSPAVALLPKTEFGDGKIDLKRHDAELIEDRCERIDGYKYRFEMLIRATPESEPKEYVIEHEIASAKIYNNVPGLARHRSPFDDIVTTGQPWGLWMGKWGSPVGDAPLTVTFPNTYLRDFAVRANGVCATLNWNFADACRLVAVAQEPDAFPDIQFNGRYTFPYPMHLDMIQLEVAPHIAPATLKRAYEVIWNQLQPAPPPDEKRRRSIGKQNEEIYKFVERQKLKRGITQEPTTAELDEMYQEWQWPPETSSATQKLWAFRRGYERAQKALHLKRS